MGYKLQNHEYLVYFVIIIRFLYFSLHESDHFQWVVSFVLSDLFGFTFDWEHEPIDDRPPLGT